MSELVFVYGTLKEGFDNHIVMMESNGVLVSKPARMPYFNMYDQGYFPAAVCTDSKNDVIYGEIYSVDSLAPLDRLEGYPTHYDRVQVDTQYGKVWVYVYADPEGDLIASGQWTK